MTLQPLYLDIFLEPVADLLTRDDVTDIFVNQPGEVWIERTGGEVERLERPELSEALLWRLARQIASFAHQGINREHPLLAARLPDGTRVQVIAPPATRGSIAVAFRKHLAASLSLAQYDHAGAFDDVRPAGHLDADGCKLAELYRQREWGRFLAAAVLARKTILISGGTSSGKTTFLNALLAEVPLDERLLLIEDTPEIALSHPNAVGTVAVRGQLGESAVSAEDLLIAALRMRPDRVILGEVRGQEAFTFLRAANSGHPGSMTTIHADSPLGAIEQLALLASSGGALRREDVVAYANKVIDIVIQLERRAGKRRVASIDWVSNPSQEADEPVSRNRLHRCPRASDPG